MEISNPTAGPAAVSADHTARPSARLARAGTCATNQHASNTPLSKTSQSKVLGTPAAAISKRNPRDPVAAYVVADADADADAASVLNPAASCAYCE